MTHDVRYRARRYTFGKKAMGPFTIESSRNGEQWTPAISGLSAQDVQLEFERLAAVGKKIIDTADFTFKQTA